MAQVLDSNFNALILMENIDGQKLLKPTVLHKVCGITVLPDKASTSLSTECVDKKAGR